MATSKTSTSPLLDAIDADAFEWLSHYSPIYLSAIEAELARGWTPEQIRNFMLRHVGPDRSGLALRAEQAARYLQRTQD